jgi:DNA-binding NarL/FixJ family response regulator
MKFLIVDDHALIREALRGVLLSLRPGATVLEAEDARSALQSLQTQMNTDLVLLDLHLPDQDGLQVLATVAEQYPSTAVVMLSGDKDHVTIRRAIDLGAQGFIPKTETRDVLLSALALVLAGGIYVPASALHKSADDLSIPQFCGLTARQLDVLALLMEGKNNKTICRELNLAEPTIKNHISAILKALGVNSRTEAVVEVTRLGWSLTRVGQRIATSG